jgi:hypothetical protein
MSTRCPTHYLPHTHPTPIKIHALQPLFLVAMLSRKVQGRVLENIQEDGLKLLEDHSGNSKVARQALDFVPKFLVQIGHVGPLAHLVEKLDETETLKVARVTAMSQIISN